MDMTDKKQERKQVLEALTRQHILDGVIKVITSDGIAGLTMDKVATEAHVAKGTLYVHFQNKEQILEAAVEWSIAPLLDQLVDILNSKCAPVDKLRNFSRCHLQFFATHRELFRIIIIHEQEKAFESTKRYRSDRYWGFVKHLAVIITEGMRMGVFATLDPAKVAIMFAEANRAIVVHCLASNDWNDIEGNVGIIMKIFLHGISTETPASKPEGK